MKEIAYLTVDLLLHKIEGKEVATTGYFLPVTLLPRKKYLILIENQNQQLGAATGCT